MPLLNPKRQFLGHYLNSRQFYRVWLSLKLVLGPDDWKQFLSKSKCEFQKIYENIPNKRKILDF